MPAEAAQLGVGIAALAIVFFVVKYFVAAISKKDEQIIALNNKFSEIVLTHMTENTEQTKILSEEIKKQTETIREVHQHSGCKIYPDTCPQRL